MMTGSIMRLLFTRFDRTGESRSLRKTCRKPMNNSDWLERRDVPAVGFASVSLMDQYNLNPGGFGSFPPDTMGAIGPNHFVESINSSFAVYDKAGTRQLYVSADSFFTSVRQGGTFDPRILYDRLSGRWFACTLERGVVSGQDNDILLAVSKNSNPTWNTAIGSPADSWDFYRIDVSVQNSGSVTTFTDYDTMGVDSNGVYFAATYFPSSGSSYSRIAATPKTPLLAATPSLGTLTVSGNITDMYSTPQPATNLTNVSSTSPFYFVSSSASVYGNINYRTVSWSGGVPSFSTTSALGTPGYGPVLNAPALGSTTNINAGDNRLQMAVVRDGKLWTTRNVGVNSSGGASGVDRTAVEWLNLDVSGASPSLIQSGRIYDSALTDPRFYYYPSLTVTGQGIVRIGFSGSKSTEYVGDYSSVRLLSDPAGTISSPLVFKSGQGSYTKLDGIGRNRWGDYSFTSVDPNDDMTAWTIQEYTTATSNIWGTWVQSFNAPAPVLTNPSAAVQQGTTSATLNLSGTGFFNPGPGFVNQLNVAISGTGISNVVSTYNSPTSVTVTYDVAASATPGSRNITLTNPDGQSVTVVGGLTVQTQSQPLFITNVTSPISDGVYGIGTTIPITLTMSSVVTVTGTPTLQLNSGGSVYANYLTGSGTSTLTFQYVVAAGQSTSDLDYSSIYALAGGTIKDLNNNAINYDLPAPGVTGSLSYNKNIVIDQTLPANSINGWVYDVNTSVGIGHVRVYNDANLNGKFDGTQISQTSATNVVRVLDLKTVTKTLVVSNPTPTKPFKPIYGMTVSVNLPHTHVGDLIVTLISPAGTRIRLINRQGADGQNLKNATFDDSASTQLPDSQSSYTGSYLPYDALSGLNGESVIGTWKLEVSDNALGDVGSLTSFTVNVTSTDEANVFTKPSGNYSFPNASAGDWKLRVDLSNNPTWTVNNPASGQIDYRQPANASVGGLNFGIKRPALIGAARMGVKLASSSTNLYALPPTLTPSIALARPRARRMS